ncbi:MAG TPA: ABC transporter permease [Solirubrobacterales bacterium]|nr:ABC transporter permease [Solirubrobacterales bacterium]
MKTGARALDLLRQRPLWIAPLVVGSVLIAIITVLYVGSTVDPLSHMHGLPVTVVDEDTGAGTGGPRFELGRDVEAALIGAPAVADKLDVEPMSLAEARERMDTGKAYATVVIPPDFTTSALTIAGYPAPERGRPRAPTVLVLSNPRAGVTGANLATGVLQPALTAISEGLGRRLKARSPTDSTATRAALDDPIAQQAEPYRPLPSTAALGLSAFYAALLTLMCGFLSAAIVNGVLDGALGFAPSEIGPHWELRRPVLISRWQTLLAKWAVAAVLTGVLTAVMLLVAAVLLGMDAPDPILLWLYSWLCAATVAVGTLALIAALGTQGQLLALVIFVYLGLASAGGTVPIQALPPVLEAISHLDPLRQILAGVRSILYFEARGDAGLTEGALYTVAGLAFWLAFGTFFVRRYDRKGRYRLDPGLLAYVNDSVDQWREREGAEAGADRPA